MGKLLFQIGVTGTDIQPVTYILYILQLADARGAGAAAIIKAQVLPRPGVKVKRSVREEIGIGLPHRTVLPGSSPVTQVLQRSKVYRTAKLIIEFFPFYPEIGAQPVGCEQILKIIGKRFIDAVVIL